MISYTYEAKICRTTPDSFITHHISKLSLPLPVGSPLAQRLLLGVGGVLDLPGEAGAALVLPLVPVLLAVEDVTDGPRNSAV